jgi:hypothetical protein
LEYQVFKILNYGYGAFDADVAYIPFQADVCYLGLIDPVVETRV